MPQLDFATYTGQLFWLAISFLVLYALVSRLILPSIAGVVDLRAQNIAADLDKAESLNNEANDADEKAQKILTESSGKARALIAESAGKAKSKLEAKRAELTMQLEQKIKKAESEIAKVEQESATAVENLSNIMAMQIANQILKAA